VDIFDSISEAGFSAIFLNRERNRQMSNVPSRIIELVAKPPVDTFDRNIVFIGSQRYNETQLRREFIDPFFEQLGWDVTNKLSYT
jgi:hypothetical protein